MVDDRDVAGPQALDQVLRLAPEPRPPDDRRDVSAGRSWISGPRSSARARLRRAIAPIIARIAARASARPTGSMPSSRLYAALSSSRAWRLAAESPRSPPEHADDLGDELVAGDALDRRARASPSPRPSRSGSGSRRATATCGRWVMQSTWRPAASPAQALAHRPRRVAADPGVDLVEDQRALALAAGEPAEREHDPRELAARGGVLERRGRHPRVGRDQQLDRLGAVGPEAVGMRLERDLEPRPLHRQLGELAGDPLAELAGGRAPRRR